MSRGRPWSTEYLDRVLAAWALAPDLTSAEFVAAHAPELPARTLRQHAQQKEIQRRSNEVQQLRDQVARLQANPGPMNAAHLCHPVKLGDDGADVRHWRSPDPTPPATGPPVSPAAAAPAPAAQVDPPHGFGDPIAGPAPAASGVGGTIKANERHTFRWVSAA